MKKQLLLYLFIVALLMNIFTYMYFTKKEASNKKSSEVVSKRYKDSVVALTDKLYDANYFSLENNDNAQNYFENHDYNELIPIVKNELMNYNDSPQGNIYVDQPMIGEQKFIINKIKILNARWIIADFNNGQIWGEVLLKYFVNNDKKVTFETIQTFIYPPNN